MLIRKFLTKSLPLLLLLIFGVGALVYRLFPGAPLAVSVEVPVVSSDISVAPRPLTAPWLSYDELSALYLDAYYQVIVEHNIFRPLQRHSSVKINPYRLIGTVVKSGVPVGYILNTFTRRVYPVRDGDWLEPYSVVSVTAKSVSLRDKARVISKLELGSMFLK